MEIRICNVYSRSLATHKTSQLQKKKLKHFFLLLSFWVIWLVTLHQTVLIWSQRKKDVLNNFIILHLWWWCAPVNIYDYVYFLLHILWLTKQNCCGVNEMRWKDGDNLSVFKMSRKYIYCFHPWDDADEDELQRWDQVS